MADALKWTVCGSISTITNRSRTNSRPFESSPASWSARARRIYHRPKRLWNWAAVDNRVLVPRPETEGLVERALEVIDADKRLRVVDVGCGSGCITLALATGGLNHITGVDISEDALGSCCRSGRRCLSGGV